MRTEKIQRIVLDEDDTIELDLDGTIMEVYKYPHDAGPGKSGWCVEFGTKSQGQLFKVLNNKEEITEDGLEMNNPTVVF